MASRFRAARLDGFRRTWHEEGTGWELEPVKGGKVMGVHQNGVRRSAECPRRGFRSSAAAGARDSFRLGRDVVGAGMVEYIILVGVIALLALGAYRLFGNALRCKILEQGETVSSLDGSNSVSDCGADSGPSGDPTASAEAQRVHDLANALARLGGTATESDRQAVIRELERLPAEALEALRDHGVHVTVVHDSVVEALPHLAGVRPRGWPPGSTWDTVPGLYDPATNQVIIATRGGAVPATGNGHGSVNLVVHETGHALDASVNGHGDPAFVAARNQDLPNLSTYQTQPGTAGLEETYAESLALYESNPSASQATQPNLHAYWASNPVNSSP